MDNHATTGIRIGVNPLFWMNSDIPSLGEHIPVEQGLSEAALIGYAGVELEDAMRTPLTQTPALLRQRSLELVGGWHSTFLLKNDFEQERQRLIEHLQFLKAFGSDLVILAECSGSIHREPKTPLSKRPSLDKDGWQRLCHGLERLVEIATDHGMRTAYHHHMGTVVQTEHDIDKLINSTTHLQLLFDTGHLVYAGADILSVWEKHSSRVGHIHLKNVRYPRLNAQLRDGASFTDSILAGVFTVPGDNGSEDNEGLEFLPLMKALVRARYRGWLVIEAEQDPRLAHPFAYARLGYQTARYLLSKAEMMTQLETPKAQNRETQLLAPLV